MSLRLRDWFWGEEGGEQVTWPQRLLNGSKVDTGAGEGVAKSISTSGHASVDHVWQQLLPPNTAENA